MRKHGASAYVTTRTTTEDEEEAPHPHPGLWLIKFVLLCVIFGLALEAVVGLVLVWVS